MGLHVRLDYGPCEKFTIQFTQCSIKLLVALKNAVGTVYLCTLSLRTHAPGDA